jgi:hypothetical protein
MLTVHPGESVEVELPKAEGRLEGRPAWSLDTPGVASLVVHGDGSGATLTAGPEPAMFAIEVEARRATKDGLEPQRTTIKVATGGGRAAPAEEPPPA